MINSIHSFNLRHRAACALVAMATFALYVFTAPPGVAFEDSPAFAFACQTGGLPHAPGFPLYAILCIHFAHLPGISPAFGVTILSAICGAGAAAILYWIAFKLIGGVAPSLTAALLFGFGETLWSQSNIQEVYAMNTLLFLAAFAIALQFRETPKPSLILILALVCGFGIANHWPLFILAGTSLPVLIWNRRRELIMILTSPKFFAGASFLFLIGISPYLYSFWRGSQDIPFIALPYVIDDFNSFWRAVSRDVYNLADHQPGATLSDKPQFIYALAKQFIIGEFSIVGGAFALAGFFLQWKKFKSSIAFALVILFAASPLIIIATRERMFDIKEWDIFRNYLPLIWAAAALWGGVAAAALLKRIRLRIAALILPAIISAFCIVDNFSANDRRHQTFSRDIATVYFNLLPPNADAFVNPQDERHLRYHQFASGERRDISIHSIPIPNNLEILFPGKRLYPRGAPFDEKIRIINQLALDGKLPICYNGYIPFAPGLESDEYLFFSCLRKQGNPPPPPPPSEKESQVRAFFLKLAAGEFHLRDPNAIAFKLRIIEKATYTLRLEKSRGQLSDSREELLEILSATPAGQLADAEWHSQSGINALSPLQARELAGQFNADSPAYARRQKARMHVAIADILAAASDSENIKNARAHYLAAIEIFPSAYNPAVRKAIAFFARIGENESRLHLLAKYGDKLETINPRLRLE